MILKTQVFASSLCPAGVSYPFTFMLDSVLVIISESRHGTLDFHIAQLVKNLPTMQETWVQSLGWEDPLEKEKATHSSVLAWRIP